MIPSTDSSNLRGTQNFEEAFLNMKPGIGDFKFTWTEEKEEPAGVRQIWSGRAARTQL
jgi:hypothetical protein